jgi:hypothetical protein
MKARFTSSALAGLLLLSAACSTVTLAEEAPPAGTTSGERKRNYDSGTPFSAVRDTGDGSKECCLQIAGPVCLVVPKDGSCRLVVRRTAEGTVIEVVPAEPKAPR